MTEVEIKAPVEEPEVIERRIAALSEFQGEYLKEDRYYCLAEECKKPLREGTEETRRTEKKAALSERARFRLRFSGGEAVVTYKRKRLEGSHEVNEEHEFAVSDPDAFEAFAAGIGYRLCARKRKSGKQYRSGDGTGIELAEVSGLGWYLEIEALVEEDDREAVAAAKERVAELFRRLGIDEERFERRYYIDMLAEAGEEL